MKEVILGQTQTVEFDDHVVIAFEKKILKLNDGKQIKFEAKINEHGKIVLESQALSKLLSNTGTDNCVKR